MKCLNLLIMFLLIVEAGNAQKIMGFTDTNAANQTDWEKQFDTQLSTKNMDTWMQFLTSHPHHLGSPQDKANAEYIANLFMQWGYQAQSYDIGDGDNQVGMDSYYYTDYPQMVSIYSTRAAQFAAITTTKPTQLAPTGNNVARFCTGWQADSIYGTGNEGDKVYDGIISEASKWCSNGSAPPHWLAINLGQPRWVNGFTVRLAGSANEWIIFNFKNFQLQSGSSLTGPWTTEFTIDNSPQFSYINCLFDSPKQIQYLRIYITNCGIDNYVRLPELEVYETIPTEIKSSWQLFE